MVSALATSSLLLAACGSSSPTTTTTTTMAHSAAYDVVAATWKSVNAAATAFNTGSLCGYAECVSLSASTSGSSVSALADTLAASKLFSGSQVAARDHFVASLRKVAAGFAAVSRGATLAAQQQITNVNLYPALLAAGVAYKALIATTK